MHENFKPEEKPRSESLHEMKERLDMLINQEKSTRRTDPKEADELLSEIESLQQKIATRNTRKVTTWYNEENYPTNRKPAVDTEQRVKDELKKMRDRLQ